MESYKSFLYLYLTGLCTSLECEKEKRETNHSFAYTIFKNGKEHSFIPICTIKACWELFLINEYP